MGDMTANFSRWEFACKCGCGFDTIDPALVVLAQTVRDIYGKSMTINSGCRCLAYNTQKDSKPTSAHVKGLAIDVHCVDNHLRFLLIRAAIRAGYSRVGVYPTFVHIDTSTTLPQQVVWR